MSMKAVKKIKRLTAAAAVAAAAVSSVIAPVALTGTQTVMADDVVSLSKNSVTMKNKGIDLLVARVEGAQSIRDRLLVWESSNPDVVKVTAGLIRAVGEGTAVVTAKTQDGNNSDSCIVNVTANDYSILEDIKIDLAQAGTKALSTIENLKTLMDLGIMFVTENEQIAKISNGVITAVKEGATNLYAVTQDGARVLIGRINVLREKIQEIIPITKISFDEARVSIQEGASRLINAVIEPFNATDKQLIWQVDDQAVAKVVDGVVTAVKEGTTRVRALTKDGKVVGDFILDVVKAVAKDGWVNKDGVWYYYRLGEAYTGWHWMTNSDGEKIPHWSYFGQDGKLRTGWVWLTANDGESTAHWSYFGPNGWLRTGWQRMSTAGNPDGTTPEHWSYFGANGWLRTNWVQLGKGTAEPDGNNDKHWSYFGPNGWLRTGWQLLGQGTENPDGNNPPHTSYFGDNGWLRTGRQTIGGRVYVFDGRGWQI